MKIRAELHLGGSVLRAILVARPEEKLDHLAMKLAALTLFHAQEPIVEPSSDHPTLIGQDLKPDVFTLDEGGDVKTWIECGTVSLSKLDKLGRRFPRSRFIVLKTSLHEAKRLRETMADEVKNGDRIEVWTWPEGAFREWMGALQDKTEIFGEAHEKSFNVVVNNTPYAHDLISI